MARTTTAVFALCALSAVALVSAEKGVDVSSLWTASDYSCLVTDHDMLFTIVRVWRSTNEADSNGPSNIKNAWSGGMHAVDGYVFPCPTCSTSGANQVKNAVSYLNDHGVTVDYYGTGPATVGQLWLDIEGTQYWSSSHSTNVDFIQSMVDGCNDLGITCGIYTSESQWSTLTGNSKDFSKLQLWTAYWDGDQSLSADWSSYGGWSSPTMKQYQGSTSKCSMNVDLDSF